MSEIDKSKYIDILKDDLRESAKAIAAKDHELERHRQELEKQSRIIADTNAKINELLEITIENRKLRQQLQANIDSLTRSLPPSVETPENPKEISEVGTGGHPKSNTSFLDSYRK